MTKKKQAKKVKKPRTLKNPKAQEKKELKQSVSVVFNKETGVFTFNGRSPDITRQKNKALAPYNKMVHNYGIVVELLPSKEQVTHLNTHVGHARFVRNKYLGLCKEYYEQNHTHLTVRDYKKNYLPALKDEYPFLKDADKFAIESALEHVETAFENFFGGKAGYPRFVASDTPVGSKYTTKFTNNNIEVVKTEEGCFLKLPKTGNKPVKFILPKGMDVQRLFDVNTRILKVTVSKVGRRYFASVGVETIIDLVRPIDMVSTDRIYASDMGLKDFAIYGSCEFTEKVENPRWVKLHAKRFRRKQQALSRKKKGSNNYQKAKLAVAKEHRKCANQRKDMHHKLSRKIANEADVFICEDLNVKGMVKNRHLAKSISSVGWSQFLSFVKYKIEAKGGILVKVDRFFPSSKLCNCCGYKNTELTLKDRFWVCPKCGTRHDRDINAKNNLLREGMSILVSQGCVITKPSNVA